MLCAEVTRELAAPSGRCDPADLASHLAACPACAALADGFARFDRLWEATRPPEPPAGAFDALWAEVARAADLAPGRPESRRRLVRRGLLAFAVAQAAAVLIAALTLSAPRPVQNEAPPQTRAQPIQVEIPEGQVVLIHVDGLTHAATVVDLTPEPTSSTVATDFDLLNEFESMAAL